MMKIIGIFITLMLLAGCATSIPQAENFPESKQKKLMAAQHWNFVAQDAVERTQAILTDKGFDQDTPLYVLENSKTVFDHAFRKYMIANLIETGAVVSTKKVGALEIEFDTQVIKHAAYFEPDSFGYKPGMATAGVAGFWVLRDVVKDLNFLNGLATVGIAAGYDAYKANNPGETGVELLLTTSITHRDRYVMLNADAYYIENAETWLFEPCKGRNRRYCK